MVIIPDLQHESMLDLHTTVVLYANICLIPMYLKKNFVMQKCGPMLACFQIYTNIAHISM